MTDDTTPDAALSARLEDGRKVVSHLHMWVDHVLANRVEALIELAQELESRAVAAEKRATEAEVLHAAMKATAGKYASEAFKAEAEVARLQGIVEKAPHEDTCAIRLSPDAGYPCSCWKRDVILAAPEKEGEQ